MVGRHINASTLYTRALITATRVTLLVVAFFRRKANL